MADDTQGASPRSEVAPPAAAAPGHGAREGSSSDAVMARVSSILVELLDEDDLDLDITMETTFAELEVESIMVVALVEQLQDVYGEGLDLVGWLSNMDIDEIITLSVGSFVEYIVAWHTS